MEAKQSLLEALKKKDNIVVTTRKNPSIDDISAAIGLTLLLRKLNKRVHGIVSSKYATKLEHLSSGEVLDNDVSGVRDFIISLNKEKADKLRYKVEGDEVRIFITPYKTVLKEDDFEFSQGDYNVDVLVGVNVPSTDDLDDIVLSHSQLLKKADVYIVNNNSDNITISGTHWSESSAGSVSEMIYSLVGKLGDDVLDVDSAQALLTGIIDSTHQFSSERTTPKIMTTAGQLMEAGANQASVIEALKKLKISNSPMPEKKKESTDDSKKDEDLPKPSKKDDETQLNLDHKKDSKKDNDEKSDQEKKSKEDGNSVQNPLPSNAPKNESKPQDSKTESAISPTPESAAPINSNTQGNEPDQKKPIRPASASVIAPNEDEGNKGQNIQQADVSLPKPVPSPGSPRPATSAVSAGDILKNSSTSMDDELQVVQKPSANSARPSSSVVKTPETDKQTGAQAASALSKNARDVAAAEEKNSMGETLPGAKKPEEEKLLDHKEHGKTIIPPPHEDIIKTHPELLGGTNTSSQQQQAKQPQPQPQPQPPQNTPLPQPPGPAGAREAVNRAIAANPDPIPRPTQSLNSQPMGNNPVNFPHPPTNN